MTIGELKTYEKEETTLPFRLNTLGDRVHLLAFQTGTQILFSYGVPVGLSLRTKWYTSCLNYSPTTTKHINTYAKNAVVLPHGTNVPVILNHTDFCDLLREAMTGKLSHGLQQAGFPGRKYHG